MINGRYRYFFTDEKLARAALGEMKKTVNKFGRITVHEINEMMEQESFDPLDVKFGWTDLLSAYITKSASDGYFLYLPDPVDITERFKKDTVPEDMVNHPKHYQSETGLEAIDVIEAFTFDLKGIEAVCTGNSLKYLCRWKNKNGLQDLKKARWYLDRLIKHVEKLEEENKKI